jgi:two-component system cell cycle response regulator
MTQKILNTVLFVDNDPVFRNVFRSVINTSENNFLKAGNSAEAIELLNREKVDLVILDIIAPEVSGFEVLGWLKDSLFLKNTPVFAVSALEDRQGIGRALQMGAQDFMYKPITSQWDRTVISLKVKNALHLKNIQDLLEHNLKQADKLCLKDDVTSLYNYRYFRERLYEEFLRSRRYDSPMSLIVIDLDNLKSINDHFGHPIGTRVISMVGTIIQKHCRSADIPVRYGGDEFCIIAPEVDLEQAIIPAERLREEIEGLGKGLEFGDISLTASLGIATQNAVSVFKSEEDLLKSADDSCYEAKKSGRNCVYCYQKEEFVPAQSLDI